MISWLIIFGVASVISVIGIGKLAKWARYRWVQNEFHRLPSGIRETQYLGRRDYLKRWGKIWGTVELVILMVINVIALKLDNSMAESTASLYAFALSLICYIAGLSPSGFCRTLCDYYNSHLGEPPLQTRC
ncbi:MAG: hypothetical protein A2754_02480 [Candidatus Magasanikbacteria bacterium RIFCSPHIGHO2_01_FULL_47_8]|uniref:Uncharacterized protein n=1 Tax=Candidatus Magasanikbacteria bacterium RIFCSPHIGHO2_01_FULL_47_8 TaxID=1798673 RepID=A0A1F6MBX7_9BACT|nr:MAG: hypothetical protein A2754_02480 [Candidatus Magasanikbacteria bacterium RIFCSPHIGHO2_01_FULL_47_8]